MTLISGAYTVIGETPSGYLCVRNDDIREVPEVFLVPFAVDRVVSPVVDLMKTHKRPLGQENTQ